MKRRTQKIFITLLSLFIAGFAMVNAYTFEVLNWNPFGVLNLKTLIMKPDVNTTWIIIDGASYTIKIDPNHESEDWWIWVDRICDENWENCKGVSELLDIEWGDIKLNNIDIIPWTDAQYCYATETWTIICTGDLRNKIPLIQWNGQDYICTSDGNWNAICEKVKLWEMEDGKICIYNLGTKSIECIERFPDTLGDLWDYITWTNNRRCRYQCLGWTISITWNCNSLALWDERDKCNAIAAEYHENWCSDTTNNVNCQNAIYSLQREFPSWITVDAIGWCSIVCDQPEPSCSGQCSGWWEWSPYILEAATSTKLWWVKLWSDDPQRTTVNTPSHAAGKTYPIQFDEEWKLVVNVPRVSWNWSNSGISMSQFVPNNQNYYCYSLDSNTISCNAPMPSWGNGGSWITLLSWINNMYCKYIEWSDGKGGSTKWINCTYDAWSSTPTWSWDSLWKKTYSALTTRYTLSPSLSDGTYRIELNPWSSSVTPGAASRIRFDSKWIRINNWAQFYSWAWLSVAWNIMIWNTSTDNYIYIYATWNNIDPNKRFEIFWNQELSIWTTNGSYLYFAQKSWTVWYRLWVNTSDPKATLDVKWWIRIGSNCEQRICTGTNVWTIIYTAARWFIGCKYISSNNYKRVSLDGWTRSGTSYATNQTCQIYSYSNDIVSNTTTQNEY